MKILTFGDSHSNLLRLSNELKEINTSFRGVVSEVVSLSGATIIGFGKRESSLNSRKILIDKVNDFQPDVLCFALGQVDIELGYYYKRVIKEEEITFQDFSKGLIDKYIENTHSLIEELGFESSQVIFKGVNLSVLTNSRRKAINYTSRIITENISVREDILNFKQKLENIFPSNIERAHYHLSFNNYLNSEACRFNMKYFDINKQVEDKERKGMVSLEFIPSGEDHHLVDSLYIRTLHIESLLHSVF